MEFLNIRYLKFTVNILKIMTKQGNQTPSPQKPFRNFFRFQLIKQHVVSLCPNRGILLVCRVEFERYTSMERERPSLMKSFN